MFGLHPLKRKKIEWKCWKSDSLINFGYGWKSQASSENLAYVNSLRWRHNWRDSASNHQPYDCLLNRLFRRRKYQSAASLAFVRRIHRGPVNSPHKWPVTRKMFPFDDVIMTYLALGSTWLIVMTALICLIEAVFYLWIVITWYLQYPFLSTRNLWYNVVNLF